MTQANLKKLKVRINETNDDTPKKVRRLVNRCCRESMLSEGHILEQLLKQQLSDSDSGKDKHFPSFYIVNVKGLSRKHSSTLFSA